MSVENADDVAGQISLLSLLPIIIHKGKGSERCGRTAVRIFLCPVSFSATHNKSKEKVEQH
jgi:hypothetical protein